MASLLFLVMAAAAAAITTTLEIYATMLEGNLVATVLGVDDPLTTLGISCHEDALSDCMLSGIDLITYIYGPSTMSYFHENKLDERLMEGNCELSDCERVECENGCDKLNECELTEGSKYTYTDAVGNDVTTGADHVGNYRTMGMTTVTVTAGAEKLTTPTETSGDVPKETGANEEEEDEDEAAQRLARGSLLAAAVAAVGAALF